MTHWSLPRGESGLCLASHETLFCSHERSLKSPEKLTEAFSDPTPTNEEINRTLEAMELIAPLSEKETARKSHQLFHVVMKAPRSLPGEEVGRLSLDAIHELVSDSPVQ